MEIAKQQDTHTKETPWGLIITGALLPPFVLFFLKLRLFAAFALGLIIASLVVAQIYHSLGNWPFALWLFPIQLAVHLITGTYLYRHFQNPNEANLDKPIIIRTLSAAIIFLGIPWLFIYLVFSQYAISSVSMNPNLIHGDYVLSIKSKFNQGGLSSMFAGSGVEIGDLVIFKHPQEDEIYVKRIVAAAGDTVRFNGNDITINGITMKQDVSSEGGKNQRFQWLKNQTYLESNGGKTYEISFSGDAPIISGETTVPPGHYFVMGDNRNQSIDSRFWGILPAENILEKPILIWWSTEPGTKPKIRWERIATILN